MAIWLLTGFDSINTKEDIADYLNVSLKSVKETLDFLLKVGLVAKDKDDNFKIGQTKTHIKRDHPLVSRHHTNWRLKTIKQLEDVSKEELVFTAPLSISKKDFQTHIGISLFKLIFKRPQRP